MKRWPRAKGYATGEETKRPNPKIQTDMTKLVLFLAPTLSVTTTQAEIQSALSNDARALVYFMDKLGGEIDIPGSRKSPEFKLDTTHVEIVPDANRFNIGRHGILKVQTMDFYGSYRAATESLTNALKLHPKNCSEVLTYRPRTPLATPLND